MSKLIVFNFITLDGFFAAPDGALDWHQVDAVFQEFAIDQLHSVNTILFGRKTYQFMESYWTTEHALKTDPLVTGLMNNTPKVVFSTTLKEATWNHSTLVKENIEAAIHELKNKTIKDLLLLGSANLCTTLINLGLIDEYRIMINPVLLGKGIPMFRGLENRFRLELLRCTTFSSGNVLLYYKPAN
jgi:dihydrofolate reductase